MKTRIITGLLIFLFVFPFVVFGGHFMMAFVLLLLAIGVYEFLSVMKKAFLDEIPLYIYITSSYNSSSSSSISAFRSSISAALT